MITTLIVLVAICILSLGFILVIPSFAATKVFMRFLPEDIREAAKDHPDPPAGRRFAGYLLTAAAVGIYLAALLASWRGRPAARLWFLASFWKIYLILRSLKTSSRLRLS